MPLVVKDHKVVYEKPTEYPVFGRLLILNPIDRMYKNHAKIRAMSSFMSGLQGSLLHKPIP